MRLNFRKVFLIGAAVAFLWIIVTYSSMIEVPRATPVKNNVVEIENRIDKLQQQMDEQISDSSMLLETVKKHLKKTDSNGANSEDSEKIIMPGTVHLDPINI